jgi:MoaA/NifB/PqqE/SkfB family radical SAM enzyme
MPLANDLIYQKKPVPVHYRTVEHFPRILLGASIDLTYRCNQNCRHCWLWLPADARETDNELTTDEIRRIADEARALGVREWTISGGEPMLRADFVEILEYLTLKARSFTLKTNGTLMSPQIARLLTRPGETWVSLYGSTAEVYDRITRSPGGFDRALRGIALLKEAGVRLVIQAFPMRENWHQWPQMVELARSLSPDWRVGASWLHLSAEGDPLRNAEIAAQRLDPKIVIDLDQPSMTEAKQVGAECGLWEKNGDRLLRNCISSRREVHIDPYGGLSVCCSAKDPALRYDLRRGSMNEAWEEFVPSLAEKVLGGENYRKQCGVCELRDDCRWCPMYAYIENRDHSTKVDYLCAIAQETRRFKENWRVNHRRFYQVGGITVQVESDLPFNEKTFQPALAPFEADSPGPDLVRVRHWHSFEGLRLDALGKEVSRQGPWTIFRKGDSWIYRCSSDSTVYAIGVFSADHSRGRVFHADEKFWLRGGLNSLSLPITDQLLLARLLAERNGCILHSAGVILDNQGWLFLGHSEAGKTTVTRLLEHEAEILCDDRNIVRRLPEGYRLYGTWSHGESPLVSARSAPLRAALFLKQAHENRLLHLADRKEIRTRMLACLVRGFVDSDWWNHILDFAEAFSRDIPCFELRFTKQVDLAAMLRELRA